jgi:hypothetical protein
MLAKPILYAPYGHSPYLAMDSQRFIEKQVMYQQFAKQLLGGVRIILRFL